MARDNGGAYEAAHKHASIQGCVSSDATGLSLRNEKDRKIYALGGDSAGLSPGRHIRATGKRTKDSAGKLIFQVQKVTKDLGTCQP